VNQIKVPLRLPQLELQKYLEEKVVLLSAYSLLGKHLSSVQFQEIYRSVYIGQRNPLFFLDLTEIAQAQHATPAQLTLHWFAQRGVVPVVKSRNIERMALNLKVRYFCSYN
jgi:diketogulonate reductase-like aldo/keto reductase